MSDQSANLRETVRNSYAAAATAVTDGGSASCCSDQPVEIDENFGAGLYTDTERADLPAEAAAASLGCGNPTAVAELNAGERVLDLGSGGGIDVLLSARRVGPTGKAYGLDMTEEMLALALDNAARAGVSHVEFLKGSIEAIPLPANTIDVVISNCVINLSVDKPTVFAEMFRVLVPGGRIGISDIVADDELTPAQRAERGTYVGCITGALSTTEYREGLRAAGFTDIDITPTHQVADRMHSAIIRARTPRKHHNGRPSVVTTHADQAPRVEIRYVPDCPFVGQVRETLQRVLSRIDLHAEVHERIGDYPSPTLVIDGRDVTGHPLEAHGCCRLDLPTEPQILDALQPPQ